MQRVLHLDDLRLLRFVKSKSYREDEVKILRVSCQIPVVGDPTVPWNPWPVPLPQRGVSEFLQPNHSPGLGQSSSEKPVSPI